MENLEHAAGSLGINRFKDESEKDFRLRVGLAYLERYNAAHTAAEIIFNKSCEEFSDFEDRVALQLNYENAQARKAKLSSENDSYSCMDWDDYQSILRNNGFERILSYDFTNHRDKSVIDEFNIWVRRKGGYLLTADSSRGKEIVNTTNLHYEINVPVPIEELDDIQRMALEMPLESAASYGFYKEGSLGSYIIDTDVREGLVSYLRLVEHSGFKTNNPWKFLGEHFLWLIDYSEKDEEDHKTIIDNKLSQLPADVQQMLGMKITERKLYGLDELLK